MNPQASGSIRTKILPRWWRFNLVGGIGVALQFALLFLLRGIFHFNYLAAAALAVEVTVVHNFLWHERYTWADRVQRSWRESLSRMLRFNLTNGAVSIGGNLALMKIMVGIGHLNYLAANAVAIVVCSLLNFWLSDAYVFERSLGTRRGARHTSRVKVANRTGRFP